MKKILGLTVAALLVVGLVGGGTWAFFSDTETSANNSLTAGTLDLNIDDGNDPVTMFSVTDVAPGDSGFGSAELTNVGSLDGELDIEFSGVSNTESTGTGEYENDILNGAGVGELGGLAEIAVYIDVDGNGSFDGSDIGLNSDGSFYSPSTLIYDTIDNYDGAYWDEIEVMGNGDEHDFVVLWRVPFNGGIDNTYQGDTVSFDVSYVLEQEDAD